MRRFISVFLIALIVAGVLCGCNKKDTESEKSELVYSPKESKSTTDNIEDTTDSDTDVSVSTDEANAIDETNAKENTKKEADVKTTKSNSTDSYYKNTEINKHKDIDGNGQVEYSKTYYTDYVGESKCEYYFNNELIYTIHDDDLTIYSFDSEYVDLDRDGEKEIFIHLDPVVNSMPGVLFAVLDYSKQDGWTEMNDNTLENFGYLTSFPIKTYYNADEDTITISCTGYDKKCTVDMVKHYNNDERESVKEEYYNLKDESPEDIGGVMSWGLWEIEVSKYDGKPCLMATQAVYGSNPRWDEICEMKIYFDYSANNDINILYIDYDVQY